MFPVNQEDDNEEYEVGNGFIELPGMARVGVDIVEDERPRHVRHLTDDFRIHQVSKPDKTGRDARADAEEIEHHPGIHPRPADVEVECDEQSGHSAVGCQPLIAHVFPRSVGKVVERNEDGEESVP